jgi:LysR family glycine cleavage system transcriptional activator
MAYRLPPLNALRAFESAARHLSFKNAARELNVTPTAISHQIKLLEDFLQVELFYRLTRSLKLTPEGETMLPKVREGLECFACAVEAMKSDHPMGRLIVVAPPSFATRWLVPRLKRLYAIAPELALHLVSSMQAIENAEADATLAYESIDLREGDSPLAICFGSGDYPGFQVDRLFASDYVAVCSPKLLEEALRPLQHPIDIRHHTLLHDDTIANERARPSWEEWVRLAGVAGIDTNAGPHFCDSGLALAAAIDGLGIALASMPIAAAEIAAGRLVAPFKVAVQQPYAYYLVAPVAISGRREVETFRRWIIDEAESMKGLNRLSGK